MTAQTQIFTSVSHAESCIGVPTRTFRNNSSVGVKGCTCDIHSIQFGSKVTGKKKPPIKEIPETIKPTPDPACLTTMTAAAISSASGKKASPPRTAEGTASAAVDQRTGMPNALTAKAIVTTPVTRDIRKGKTVSDATPATGPNGERMKRSNVPATSSWRTRPGRCDSVDTSVPRITRPTTVKPK